MVPLGCFEAQLPLFGLLPSAVDFLMCPIIDGSNVRRGTFPLLIRSSETSTAFDRKRFELACLPISQSLQAIPLLGQIFPKGVAVTKLAVQVGAGVFGQFLARPHLGDGRLGLGQCRRPARTFLVEARLVRHQGSSVLGHPGLEEAVGMLDGQLPQRRHRLPGFRREFRKL